jgi:hypothetical protein
MKTLRILLVGDIVGGPGRRIFEQVVPRLRAEGTAEFVVANAENAAGGNGCTLPLARELLRAGADVLTLGDHAWDQKELASQIDQEPRLLRAANAAPACPGRGWVTVDSPAGPVTVLSLVGRVFMPPLFDCPFRAVDRVLAELPPAHGPVLVDLHAEATSEKIAMGWHLDGRVAAVVGSHTHVPTADETILPKGTAYITDLGMTGPRRSILGREIAPVLKRFTTGMPQRFEVATDDVVLEGVVIEVVPTTGKALRIERVLFTA